MEALLRVGWLERRGRGGPLTGPTEQCARSVERPRSPLRDTPAQAALPWLAHVLAQHSKARFPDVAHVAPPVRPAGHYHVAALRAHGGESIQEEARHWGEQPLGACISTGAGRLECKRVLHAVARGRK